MARQKKKNKGEAAKLEMTPMIDVVFQLLIFFIVTLKPQDILAHLDISRPAPDPNQKPEEEMDDLLTILVYNHLKLGGKGVSIEGAKVSYEHLSKQLKKLAAHSQNVSVVIKCTSDSPHSNLVKLLDICAAAKLTNLAVFSM